MRERFRADVACAAVPDAVGRGEFGSRFRQLPVFVVTETERSDSIVLDLDHELGRIRFAA